MKNVLIGILITTIFAVNSQAQLIPDFETTLKFYHYSGIVDSVNIGFSLDADIGFDSFDVLLEDELELPFTAAIYNPLIQNEFGNDTTCAYLKTSYYNFPEQTVTTSTGDIEMEWLILFRSDENFAQFNYYGSCSNPQQSYGLTLQVKSSDLFSYQFLNDQGYYIRLLNYDGFNVCVGGIDAYDVTHSISNIEYGCIPIQCGSSNFPFVCQNNGDSTYWAFSFKIIISNKFWTSVIDDSNIPMININNNVININNNSDFNLLKLYTIQGQNIFNKKIEMGHPISTIDLKSFSNQLLIFTLENTKSNKFYSTKLILN